MSELRKLQDALDRWHNHPNSLLDGDIDLFVRAARRVANLDIEAATKAMLERIESRGVPDKYVARATVFAALGITEDDNG